MTRVEQLKQQIEALSPSEFAQLRGWLLDRDATSGKLDRLVEEAREAHQQGKRTKF